MLIHALLECFTPMLLFAVAIVFSISFVCSFLNAQCSTASDWSIGQLAWRHTELISPLRFLVPYAIHFLHYIIICMLLDGWWDRSWMNLRDVACITTIRQKFVLPARKLDSLRYGFPRREKYFSHIFLPALELGWLINQFISLGTQGSFLLKNFILCFALRNCENIECNICEI